MNDECESNNGGGTKCKTHAACLQCLARCKCSLISVPMPLNKLTDHSSLSKLHPHPQDAGCSTTCAE